jgi:hypothetical protein
MGITPFGQRLAAERWYAKGANFTGAALLLRREGGYEPVVLHLMCQGIEIVLKACLLLSSYDIHHPKLRTYGHDLESLASAATQEFGLGPMKPALADQLHALNSLYRGHVLRYASFSDVVVDFGKTPSDLVLRRMAAVLRLAQRKLSQLPPSPLSMYSRPVQQEGSD